ncbi:MAG: Uma2 family endonuclease, partial [Actinomycetota bacterium]
YYDGQMLLMSAASRPHILITSNINWELNSQLRDRPCEVYGGDLRLKVTDAGLYTYPDLTVACGDIRFEDARSDTLLNPLVVIEVLSPSTEAYDRGRKFSLYRTLDSLQEYVLVSQSEHRVERFTRQPDSEDWLYSEAVGLEAEMVLTSIGCRLLLSEVYRKVTLSRSSTSADRVREDNDPAYGEPERPSGALG